MFLLACLWSTFNAAYLGVYPHNWRVLDKKLKPNVDMLTNYGQDSVIAQLIREVQHLETYIQFFELQRKKLQEKETSIIRNVLGSSLRGTSFLDDFHTMRY